jgi:F-type H+-transporting ATPase subunit delta
MAATSVARRYARAFADVVQEQKLDPERISAELESLLAMLGTAPDLKKVWENPAIPAAQKRALLDAIVSRVGLSKPVRNFVAVIIDHHRVPMLPQAAQEFHAEINRRMGFVDAEITSMRELGDDERRELETRIGQSIGSKVRARYSTNPAILGGTKVKIGSTIYDGSVMGQLEKLRERLSAG